MITATAQAQQKLQSWEGMPEEESLEAPRKTDTEGIGLD